MELGSRISTIETASNRRGTAESFSLPASTVSPMILEPHEPFDSNRKEDSIFQGSCSRSSFSFEKGDGILSINERYNPLSAARQAHLIHRHRQLPLHRSLSMLLLSRQSQIVAPTALPSTTHLPDSSSACVAIFPFRPVDFWTGVNLLTEDHHREFHRTQTKPAVLLLNRIPC